MTLTPQWLDELRARMDERPDKADSELKSLRDKVENVAADAISPATVDTIQKAVGAIRQRLATSEKTSAETLQKLSERITQMSGLLENQEDSPQLEAVAYAVRRFGMAGIQRTGWLKRFFMDEARGISGDLPELLKA